MASCIEDIIIISGRNKRSIEDHFDTNYELEHTLEMKGKLDDLREIEAISTLANIHYIRQKEAKGLGDAIYCAHRFIGDEPFAVLLGDIILQAPIPALKQLIDTYDREKVSVIGVQQVPMESVHKYGVIDPVAEVQNGKAIEVKGFIEKPSKEAAPSNYAIMGRYILTPSIFEKLEATEPDTGGEIQLTDAIQSLNQEEQVVAQDVVGQLYDIGSKIGFVQATIDFALQREDLKDDIQAYINTKAEVTK